MSRAGKTDEFYTQLSTIEEELRHYREYFKDKIVFCNADDPAYSEDGQDHFRVLVLDLVAIQAIFSDTFS